MIFRRRRRPSFLARMRETMMPRKGIWRGFDYINKRMRRLPDSPHRIALGFACGVFVSFSPFFGFHFFLAAGPCSAESAEQVLTSTYEIDVAGTRVKAEASLKPMYDPKAERVKA